MSHQFTHLADIIDLNEPGNNNENVDAIPEIGEHYNMNNYKNRSNQSVYQPEHFQQPSYNRQQNYPQNNYPEQYPRNYPQNNYPEQYPRNYPIQQPQPQPPQPEYYKPKPKSNLKPKHGTLIESHTLHNDYHLQELSNNYKELCQICNKISNNNNRFHIIYVVIIISLFIIIMILIKKK